MDFIKTRSLSTIAHSVFQEHTSVRTSWARLPVLAEWFQMAPIQDNLLVIALVNVFMDTTDWIDLDRATDARHWVPIARTKSKQ